jgi:hypothetical protein
MMVSVSFSRPTMLLCPQAKVSRWTGCWYWTTAKLALAHLENNDETQITKT